MPAIVLTPIDRAYLRWSHCCGTVYANGAFEYTLYPNATHPETLETSRYFADLGLPEQGYVFANGELMEDDE
jgi:hypothetical protein